MDLVTKVRRVAEAQTRRFPEGNDPFKIGCRILEEVGEVVWELNHYERKGIPISENSRENKENLVNETYQVFVALTQLMKYFDLSSDFENRIDEVYQEYIDKGYLSKNG
ncbi:hypothetical protein [Bacteroides sp.]|uniref:hypothetical protein n=1 Tax=Bacteroides sp. TaxID=29523 RepID=UPI002620A21F|nr:hypothetical protein [Bacteroides sp.]MDD3041296.1 hypothetical protein [Bacteroides sp.]